MKNYVVLFLATLFFNGVAMAQSSSGTAVVVNSSYINTTYVDVYPYRGGSGNTKIDTSIHFRLRKGTKFFINKVLDANSATVGYVITPWRFPDSAKAKVTKAVNANKIRVRADPVKTNEPKADFYDTLRKRKSLYYKQLFLANAALTKAKASLKSDSLYLDTAKKDLEQSKLTMKKATDSLIKTNPTPTEKSKKAAKPEVKEFTDAKIQLITSLSKSKSLNDSTKAINTALASMKTPLSVVEKAKTQTKIARIQVDTAVANLKTAVADYNISKVDVENKKTEFALLKASVYKMIFDHNNNGQQSDDGTDDDFYTKTKAQINDRPDKITDTTSLASMYEDLAFVDSWANYWQFAITAKDFTDNCVLYYPHSNQFTWGFLTLPLKMRFDNSSPGGRFNFEQNLNFGLTFGDKMQIKNRNDISINFLAGISVVNVQLNNAVSATNSSPAVNATSTTAISMSVGSMFQYEKFQIGLFVGRDYAGESANLFPFQHKLWAGFAIGISLFGEGKTTATAQNQ